VYFLEIFWGERCVYYFAGIWEKFCVPIGGFLENLEGGAGFKGG